MKKEQIIALVALCLQILMLGISVYVSYLYVAQFQKLPNLSFESIMQVVSSVNKTPVMIAYRIIALPALAIYIVASVYAFRYSKKTVFVILMVGLAFNILKIVGLILMLTSYGQKLENTPQGNNQQQDNNHNNEYKEEIFLASEVKEKENKKDLQ